MHKLDKRYKHVRMARRWFIEETAAKVKFTPGLIQQLKHHSCPEYVLGIDGKMVHLACCAMVEALHKRFVAAGYKYAN